MQQPKIRSKIAVSAQFRTSAGAMGKHKRSKNRHDRHKAKLTLRRSEW